MYVKPTIFHNVVNAEKAEVFTLESKAQLEGSGVVHLSSSGQGGKQTGGGNQTPHYKLGL